MKVPQTVREQAALDATIRPGDIVRFRADKDMVGVVERAKKSYSFSVWVGRRTDRRARREPAEDTVVRLADRPGEEPEGGGLRRVPRWRRRLPRAHFNGGRRLVLRQRPQLQWPGLQVRSDEVLESLIRWRVHEVDFERRARAYPREDHGQGKEHARRAREPEASQVMTALPRF